MLCYNEKFILLNKLQVRYVSIAQRNCRFMEEASDIDVYRYYSYSTCCVQCRKMAQLKTCGCVHHLVPNSRKLNLKYSYRVNKALKIFFSIRNAMYCKWFTMFKRQLQ